MIETIVIDTNIVIKLFSGDKSSQDIIHQKFLLISFITEIELLSWPQLSESDYSILSSFLHDCFIIGFSQEIKNEVIHLRKNFAIKLPDAIIAATAITKSLPLFSSDDIFKRIPHLNFVHVI
jgi:predicted nucleic acid-binding protein